MSEVIVRMEMPKNCPCELSAEVFDPIGNYGGHQPCFAWYGIPARSKEFDRCVVRSERPSWCPIIGELPEQHGALIDGDLAKARIHKNIVDYYEYGSGGYYLAEDAEEEVRLMIEHEAIITATERSET